MAPLISKSELKSATFAVYVAVLASLLVGWAILLMARRLPPSEEDLHRMAGDFVSTEGECRTYTYGGDPNHTAHIAQTYCD